MKLGWWIAGPFVARLEQLPHHRHVGLGFLPRRAHHTLKLTHPACRQSMNPEMNKEGRTRRGNKTQESQCACNKNTKSTQGTWPPSYPWWMWRVIWVRTTLEKAGKKSECQRGTTARQSCPTRTGVLPSAACGVERYGLSPAELKQFRSTAAACVWWWLRCWNENSRAARPCSQGVLTRPFTPPYLRVPLGTSKWDPC